MLEVRDLDVAYGAAPALWGTSLRLAAGELVCVLGPNGAGKTTLINAIAGLHPARGGRIVLIGGEGGAEAAALKLHASIVMPAMAPTFASIVYAVPVQLLAYHTAVFMGKDADQPRNLAKSVTVE